MRRVPAALTLTRDVHLARSRAELVCEDVTQSRARHDSPARRAAIGLGQKVGEHIDDVVGLIERDEPCGHRGH